MKHYETALSIVKKLTVAGYTAYFAGGWVRDFLMNHPSDDIDIATDASVEDISRLFMKTIPVGIRFGIIIVVENGYHFEIATFRQEEGYLDGRRPTTIHPATPQQDAQRRDFTINGMFYDPLQRQVYDHVGGREDLQKETVRAIGNAHERFREDRLRMIRAVRYATRFHFAIDPDTLAAILAHAHELFPSVAIERVVQEFIKMRDFGNLPNGLMTLHRLRLLPEIFPVLRDVKENTLKNCLKHTVEFPKNAPLIAFFIELFPNSSLAEKESLHSKLKLPKKELTFLHLLDLMTTLDHTDLQKWAHLYAHPLAEMAKKIHIARCHDHHAAHREREKRLGYFIDRIVRNDPIVNSSYLMDMGIPPGKEMGHWLKKAEKVAIEKNLFDPKEIIDQLKIDN